MRIALAALGAVFFAQSGAAQEPEKADEVRVIGHYENAVGTSDAASQGYITPQLIEARPTLRPGEVLETISGVIITHHTSASVTSPKVSLIFGPFSNTEYFVNYGQGFHSNDARGTTTTADPGTGQAVEKVPALVKTKGEELGLRTEAIPNLQSSVSLWRMTLASELVFVGDAGTTEASRPSLRRGIEWSNRYIARPWLLVDLDLSASRARFTGDDPAGSRIPGAIDRVASFGVTAKDLGPWSGTLLMRYFGPRPLIEDNSVRSGSSLLWSGRASYKADPRTQINLDILNLFDRRANDIEYYYASRLRGEPTPVNDIHFHPAEPRTFRLALVTKF